MRRQNNPNQNEESELEKAIRICPSRFRSQGVPFCQDFLNKMKEALDSDGNLLKLHLWEKIGPNQTQIVFNVLKEVIV